MTRHLTFANLASGSALVIALAGGGFAVAGEGLPKNTVGSAQIKKNAIKSSDIKDGQVTGGDVDESSFGTVPSAATAATAGSATSAGTAASAGTVTGLAFTTSRTIAFGQAVDVASFGPLTLGFRCTTSVEYDSGRLFVRSSQNGAVVYVDSMTYDNALDVGQEVRVGYTEDAGPIFRSFSFAARTPAGALWQGQGAVSVSGTDCTTQVVLLG